MNTRTLLILFLACAIAQADHTMTIVQTSGTTTAYAASEVDSVTVAGDADGGVLTVYAGGSEKVLPTSTIVSMVFANDAPSDTPDGFVHIACAGKTFVMGTDSVQYNWGNVNPAHDVTLTKNFYIAKYEVTQQQFDELMKEAYPEAYTTPAWEEKYGIGPDLPAYYPSWYDAVLYCNAYTKKTGSTDTVYTYTELTGPLGGGYHDNPLLGTRLTDLQADFSRSGYRLPTEAEWCYAYLGGTTGPWYWPADDDPTLYAWGSFKPGGAGGNVQTVGTKEPNQYGLYDMAGNVYEWVNDFYGTYPAGSAVDPIGPPTNAENKSMRKGGGWNYKEDKMTHYCREPIERDNPRDNTGFRMAKTAP